MQSRRKSKNSAKGDHGQDNPLRSNALHSKVGGVARKPARVGNPSRDGANIDGDDTVQDVALEGQNLQGETKKEREEHSRTAEIDRASPVDTKKENAA